MWEDVQRFKTNDILIWPVYVNFSLKEWELYEAEYANQSLLASGCTLMVNSISEKPRAYGGAFYFLDGKIVSKLKYDVEEILYVEL